MTELKPCPFCGSTKLKIDQSSSQRKNRHRTNYDEWVLYRHYVMSVRCNCCHARGSTVSGNIVVMSTMVELGIDRYATLGDIKNEAIKAWNRRVDK